MKAKHLVALYDLSPSDISEVLDTAARIKAAPKEYATKLLGQTLAMIFLKESTRTRVSFEVGTYELGGHALFLSSRDIQLRRGETIADTARVLSRYVNGIMIRTFAHQDVLDLAKFGSVPVINGLDDLVHPCQALADYFTIREHKGKLAGLKLAYVGDGNNVAHSLLMGGVKLGVNVAIATPKGYEPDKRMIEMAGPPAAETGAKIVLTNDPVEAVRGADVVYTDVWVSMGQDEERSQRLKVFEPYQINGALFGHAKNDAIFMHCLPAHRGEEVTDEIADHPRSVIFDQAENRLHAQKAAMLLLMSH
ncbi:MAG: ornithine carbamoyltransferase [Pseudomonadota bacterium]